MALEKKMFHILTLFNRGLTKKDIQKIYSFTDEEFNELTQFFNQLTTLILNGFSEEQIGTQFEMSPFEIGKYLSALNAQVSCFYNEEASLKLTEARKKQNQEKNYLLFQKLDQCEKENIDLTSLFGEREIKNYLVFKKLRTGFQTLIDEDYAIKKEDLVKLCGVSAAKLKDIFKGNDCLNFIHYWFKEEEENLKKYYQNQSLENRNENINKAKKTFSDDIKKDKYHNIKNIDYWCSIALTYRLSLSSLADLLDFKDTSLLKRILIQQCSQKYYRGLKYLFEEEKGYVDFLMEADKRDLTDKEQRLVEDEEVLKARCKEDINFLSQCQLIGDLKNERYIKIMREIIDYDYQKLIKKAKEGKIRWNEKNIRTDILYRLKYNVATDALPKEFKSVCTYYLEEQLNKRNEFNLTYRTLEFKRIRKSKNNV